MPGRRPRLLILLTVAIVIAAVVVAVQRVGLRDLRRLEADYVAARQPTACATQGLQPFTFGRFSITEFDAELERLITEAGDDSIRIRNDFRQRSVAPLPPLRDARAALADALAAQTELYRAMISDPDGSEDELRRLGLRNTAVERKLQRARNVLLVGRPTGWDRRFICDEPPP